MAPAEDLPVRDGRRNRRIAFVTPRFGAEVVGGSEAVSREAARGLAGRGWDVEVFTTCAVDHYTWENTLPAGPSSQDGLQVRRFPTLRHLSHVGRRAQACIEEGGAPTPDEQVTWLGYQFRCPELFHHLVRFGDGYDAVVFSPYMFWTTSVGLRAVPERAVVMPCLHDENYARLDVFRHVLADPRSVWFLSEPEHDLAHRLGPVAAHHVVTGAGVDIPARYDPEGFVRRHRIARPFVLFAGRREVGKGWSELLDAFGRAVAAGTEMDLVTIGVGRVEVPGALAHRVTDLGFLGEAERNDAFAAASCFVQPSRMESFSRSVMESWLAGTPVLAVADGAVVAWHCARSGGGLLFDGADEFTAGLRRILDGPEEAAAMAARGRAYVLEHYSWDAVLDRMESDLDGFA